MVSYFIYALFPLNVCSINLVEFVTSRDSSASSSIGKRETVTFFFLGGGRGDENPYYT